jgi:hypothetical protein
MYLRVLMPVSSRTALQDQEKLTLFLVVLTKTRIIVAIPLFRIIGLKMEFVI